MTATALDRGAIIIGLRDLAAELRDEGEVAGIRLVGQLGALRKGGGVLRYGSGAPCYPERPLP